VTAATSDDDPRYWYIQRHYDKHFLGRRRRPHMYFTPGSEAEPASVSFYWRGEVHTVTAEPNEPDKGVWAHAQWLAIKIDKGEITE
jgi:hypothetical protein